MKRVILGTAGHIDHGKTTLVKALTGVDTDRLPEEKARGITIDLGFAHLQLENVDVGIVDVPGHEGLIRNMLAGATGFDAVLLVIAADEGVMPQTREHMSIARLLGIREMVVALTKVDAVEADWLELVHAEVAEFVMSEFADAPVIPVSAESGVGLHELRQTLAVHLGRAVERQNEDLFRMPIDRVFTIRGTGTVVTGTIWSGRASAQDSLHVMPAGHSARVRGVQTHGAAVASASAGERAAFALAGVDRAEIERGHVLVGAGWREVHVMTARVQLLDTELKQRQRVRIHLGTSEVLARVLKLTDAWMQLRLEKPLVARAGDRFVVRSYSPVATIGGGQVAELNRPRKSIANDELAALTELLDGAPAERMRAALHLSGSSGCELAALPVTAGVTPPEVKQFTSSLPDDVVQFDDHLFLATVVGQVTAGICARVDDHHARHPLEQGIDRAALLSDYPARLGMSALNAAERQGILVSRGSLIARSGFEPGFPPAQRLLRDRLMEQLRASGLAVPSVPELTAAHRTNEVRAVLRLMETHGDVTAIHSDLYVARDVLDAALVAVRSLGAGPWPAGDFKAALPVSRKYLIPLLEYMDRVGVTKREGDFRRVLPMEPAETA